MLKFVCSDIASNKPKTGKNGKRFKIMAKGLNLIQSITYYNQKKLYE